MNNVSILKRADDSGKGRAERRADVSELGRGWSKNQMIKREREKNKLCLISSSGSELVNKRRGRKNAVIKREKKFDR